jgi:hypothetical protein
MIFQMEEFKTPAVMSSTKLHSKLWSSDLSEERYLMVK